MPERKNNVTKMRSYSDGYLLFRLCINFAFILRYSMSFTKNIVRVPIRILMCSIINIVTFILFELNRGPTIYSVSYNLKNERLQHDACKVQVFLLFYCSGVL
jgi:hypothetical protein